MLPPLFRWIRWTAGPALGLVATLLACSSTPPSVDGAVGRSGEAIGVLDDRHADIVWQDLIDSLNPGKVKIWHFDGLSGTALPSRPVNHYVGAGWRVRLDADFYGDGFSTLLLQSDDTSTPAGPNGPAQMYVLWHLSGVNGSGVNVTDEALIARSVPGEWTIVSAIDVDGDGKDDIIWQNRVTGELGVWIMNGGAAPQRFTVAYYPGQSDPVTGATEIAVDAGRFDGSHPAVLMFDHVGNNARLVTLWAFGTPVAQVTASQPVVIRPSDPAWTEVGVGKVNADSTSDVVFFNPTTRTIGVWLMTPGTGTLAYYGFSGQSVADWVPLQIADYDGDGRADVLWHNPKTTETGIWRINVNGIGILSISDLGPIDCPWHLATLGTHEDREWQCLGPAPACNGTHSFCGLGNGYTCCDPDQTCNYDGHYALDTACCIRNGNLLTGGHCEEDDDCCDFEDKAVHVRCTAAPGTVYKRCLQCRADGVQCNSGSDCCSTLCDPGSRTCYSHSAGQRCSNDAECGGQPCNGGVCGGRGGTATCSPTNQGCHTSGDCCDFHLGHAACTADDSTQLGLCVCNAVTGTACDPSGLTGMPCCPGLWCLADANHPDSGGFVCGEDPNPPAICSGDTSPPDCGGD